jgi:hypothetical protein
MNWPTAVVAVVALFFGSCAVCTFMYTNAATESLDTASNILCYEQGYAAGQQGISPQPPLGGSECRKTFNRGKDNAARGLYIPPR